MMMKLPMLLSLNNVKMLNFLFLKEQFISILLILESLMLNLKSIPDYIHKMKDSFVSASSHGFNTWPVSVKYSVSYRKMNDRYFLNHVRGDLVFTSSQKKRLFNTQFKVFFELAITETELG